MGSILPSLRASQPELASGELDVPAEIRLDFGQLLDWYTPNIFVCWIILGINVLVFVAMLASGFNPDHSSPQLLLRWGADYGPATVTRGEWWRVISSTFVHMGFVHVGFNMLVLAQIGPFMERLLGNIAFLIVYVAAGVSGALCSLFWNLM